LAIVGAAAIAALSFGLVGRSPDYATGVGEERVLKLADGSSVRLDTDTRLTVALSASARRVHLMQGQAYFEVAHDTSRPFTVEAGPMQVRAVGTKFDVRQDGQTARVTLVEGVVEVRGRGSATWVLQPGEQVSVGVTQAKTPANAGSATSWTQGRVVFQGLPLGQAIDEINRYTTHKIRLADAAVASVPVTGSFETGDSSAFVSAVSDLHGLRAMTQPDGSIALDAKP
jgi:transmembrane sensor